MNLANSGDTLVFGAALTEGIHLRKNFWQQSARACSISDLNSNSSVKHLEKQYTFVSTDWEFQTQTF